MAWRGLRYGSSARGESLRCCGPLSRLGPGWPGNWRRGSAGRKDPGVWNGSGGRAGGDARKESAERGSSNSAGVGMGGIGPLAATVGVNRSLRRPGHSPLSHAGLSSHGGRPRGSGPGPGRGPDGPPRNPPESRTASNPPESRTAPNPPESRTAPNLPGSGTAPKPPEVRAALNGPVSRAALSSPESRTASKPSVPRTRFGRPLSEGPPNPPVSQGSFGMSNS